MKYVPVRRKRNSNRPTWMTQEILRAVRRKKRIWRAIRGGQITEEYKEAEKKVRNSIKNSKRGFEKKLAAGGGGNKQPYFSYIKQRAQSWPSIGPLKNQEGETVSDSQGMAELLNACFKEVFTREAAAEAPEPEDLQTESVLTRIQFRVSDVQTEKDREELQEPLDQLCAWADKWGMVFNVGKCKVMHRATRTPPSTTP
jgi:hypothetical protein